MYRKTFITVLFIITLAGSLHSQSYNGNYSSDPHFYGSIVTGYNGGFGFQVNGTISNFAKGFPLSARFGVGYTLVDPGQPADARKIFINNATNGIPEESGWFWDLRMDLLYNIKLFSLNKSLLYAGVRYSMFTANFKFIGGNEFFDITSDQWGLGGGLESYFALGSNFDLVITAGVDYYFSGTITGHDTSYSPDDESINPREDYTYEDADNSVNQPKILPRVMVGFNYGF
jgi:hypothetical protein